MIYDEDYFPWSDEKDYKNNKPNNMLNRHNLMTIGFWLCAFIAGGLQALQGNKIGDFSAIVSILGMAEHLFAGQTQ